MTLSEELRLSYYEEIADIEADHGIFLVQDIRNKKIYVKKILPMYNLEVFEYLMAHPIAHTPRIRELVEDGNLLILIEEYIPGNTLQEILDQQGTLAEDTVIDITIQLCRILESFHRCQPPIVNRDIKPSNLMLTGDGIVKLLDMNAAKRCSEGQEKDTVLIGTQGYAAPEQYGFGASSVLTDVYSAGVLMNVLLTGNLTGGQIANSHLLHIISKCTELSPKNRYQSITALRITLEALKNNEKPPEAPNWRRFLPPGFRSGNPVLWLFSFVCYALLLAACCTLEAENAGPTELMINRISFGVILLAIVLFSGNYLGIQSKVPLTRNKHILLRLLGIVAVDIGILFTGVLLMTLAISLII